MLLSITTAIEQNPHAFENDSVVRIGRAADNDVRVGDVQVDGEWTVSSNHIEIRFDYDRWTTTTATRDADPLTGESTALLPAVFFPAFTDLEQEVLYAYYGDFARLPRPPILEPASHTDAARRLGRTSDSGRKAIERINEKIARARDAPPAATGRNVSGEIGRWLTRAGALDGVDDWLTERGSAAGP